jgi:DNA-binding MarR family transcriptional regulator
VTDLTSLFTDLVRLETRLYNVLDARLKAEHGLPLGQFEFLRVIAARGNARVYDLAHDIAITVGATSKAVDRLESAGRVRRTANPNDRRSSLVELTPAGTEILAAATPTVEAELNTWLGSVLPAANLEQLATMLSMLRQRAESDPRTDRTEPAAPAPVDPPRT